MAYPSYPQPVLQEPSSSSQGSEHSTEMGSLHDSNHLPVLIQYQAGTIHSPTTGHAFIYAHLLPPTSLALLTKTAIQALRETHNPNNNYVIPGTAIVECLIVHWGVPAQNNKPGGLAFPATTRLSEENLEVVLTHMRRSRGHYDFVEIRFKESAANPLLGSFPIGSHSKVSPAQQLDKKKEQGGKGKGAGRGFKGPSGLDYGS